jgi:2-aminoadipate transaminase
MEHVKGSEIRNVGKKIASITDHEVVKLSAGLPDAALFPLDALREVTKSALENRYYESFQYGPTKGEKELLNLIAERMQKNENINVTPEEILITTGCQQGIALSSMAFLDKGDMVLVENPSYLDGLNACIPFECEFLGIDTDDEGMIISEVEKALKEQPNVKLVYVIPNFQNPTGKAWSKERRQQFVELMRQYPEVMIIEDNPYGEIKFSDKETPTLKSMDKFHQVIYLSSFSKILCPGMRVAWMIGQEDMMEKMEVLKEGMDLQSNQLAQIQVIEYMNKYSLDDHVNHLIGAYQKKCETMISTIKAEFPEGVKYTQPEGGMFLWVELPEGFNTSVLIDKALEKGVAYIPGESFYAGDGGKNALRLNFTSVSEEEIVKGITKLADLFKEIL